MNHFTHPGVYLIEETRPGVIAGVGTSTAAFVGPTTRGPLDQARRITSFDEFIELYGDSTASPPSPYLFIQGKPYYLPFAVEGFFTNGGLNAYIVRIGTGAAAEATINNQAGEAVLFVRAREEGVGGNGITVETQLAGVQGLAQGSAAIDIVAAGGATITVDDPAPFRVDDRVTDGVTRARIDSITNGDLVLDAALPNAVQGGDIRIADVEPGDDSFRVGSTAGLHTGAAALLQVGAAAPERVVLQSVDDQTQFITFSAPVAGNFSLAGPPPTLQVVHIVTVGTADVAATVDENFQGRPVTKVTVDDPTNPNFRATDVFRPGDVVTSNGVDRGEIVQIQGNQLILNQTVAGVAGAIRIGDLTPAQRKVRVADTAGLYPGVIARLRGDDAANPGNEIEEFVEVEAVDGAGFVTVKAAPARNNTYNLDVAVGSEPILIPQSFRLVVSGPIPDAGPPVRERFEDLSLNIFHPRNVFNPGVIESTLIEVEPPPEPASADQYPAALVQLGVNPLQNGANDNPSGLDADDYQRGLDVLRDVDDVNTVSIPDAAAHPERQAIQGATVDHCLALKERVAILDAELGRPPSGPGSVEEQIGEVRAERGFAALYYPWLEVRHPMSTSRQPRRLQIPPSGHMAGVYARVDQERGVHKAPANTDVRGVLGLERRLSDRQQGPLNLLGINALRIFPGSSQVIVWGARTTVDPNITDWVYVPVRRLLNFIEESVAEFLRTAVFEANDPALWQALRRTITDFLTRVWRDGALFGGTPEEAFQVRIDEALNPPSTRALGRLYVEIKVAPVRPAEFIVVRIGLWDGGSETTER